MDAEAHRHLLSALNARHNGEQKRIELVDSDLRGLYAPGADLVGAQLRGSKLQAAGLAGARLGRVDLSGADLTGCDLAGADLTDANLQGAVLADALLDDAILTNADLRGAHFGGVLGDPLSMASARMDRATIDRSELTEQDIAHFVARGVEFDEPAESIPPSLRGGIESRAPSLTHSLRPLEVSARQQVTSQDELDMPASLRAFKELSALIEDARKTGHISLLPPADVGEEPFELEALSGTEVPASPGVPSDIAPLSLAPPPPAPAPAQIAPFRLPEIGEEYLGAKLQRLLVGGTVTASFLAVTSEGEQVVARVFNPGCPGAALQLPAFQRGVRALCRVQALEDPNVAAAQLVAVASDMTGYLVRYYENGCLEDLMGVSISLEGKLELFRSVSNSVAALHRQGLLLRCLKPSNILVDGLSPVLGEIDMVDLPALRQSSRELHGYGLYAAPEEIVGQGTRSPTADVFALGQLLRYMLVGGERGAPALPRPLLGIIERATAFEPALRYQYVEEMVGDLDRFAIQGAVTALRPSLRPAAVSRLKAPPLTRPRREASELRPVEVGVARGARDGAWLSRSLEKGLAFVGAATFVLLVFVLWMRPALSFELEAYTLVPALIIGLAAWFLPGLPSRPALFRCTTWAVLVAVCFVFDWTRISALRWQSDLRGGPSYLREEAMHQLARLGRRDFSSLNLDGITLRSRDLGSSDFQRTSLRGSDLSGSFLMEARFTEADLTDTNLHAADLRGAKLEGAIGLGQSHCDRHTLLPASYRCRYGHIERTGT